MMSSLCKKCGVCCKLIPLRSGEQLILRDGIKNIESDFFNRLSPLSIEEAVKIDKIYTENVLKLFPDTVFYSCKNLSENNLCTLDKMPSECLSYPESPMALIPENCGYSGYVFLLSEELRCRIRKIKEEIIDYEALIQAGDSNSKSYKKIVDNLQRFVNKYAEYGSADW